MTTTTSGAVHRGVDIASWCNLAVAIILLNGGNLLLDEVAKSAGLGIQLFLSPVFLAAIGCLGLAFLFYVRSLAYLPLAVAYPVMVGISMIVVAVTNNYWHEPLTYLQLSGVVVLFLGVALISSSSRSS